MKEYSKRLALSTFTATGDRHLAPIDVIRMGRVRYGMVRDLLYRTSINLLTDTFSPASSL
jgi:hypothetical protein